MEKVFPSRSKSDSVVVSPDLVMTNVTLAGMPGPLLQPAQGMSSLALVRSAETFWSPPPLLSIATLMVPESSGDRPGMAVARVLSSSTSATLRLRGGPSSLSGSTRSSSAGMPFSSALAEITALSGSTVIEPSASVTVWPSNGLASDRSL